MNEEKRLVLRMQIAVYARHIQQAVRTMRDILIMDCSQADKDVKLENQMKRIEGLSHSIDNIIIQRDKWER